MLNHLSLKQRILFDDVFAAKSVFASTMKNYGDMDIATYIKLLNSYTPLLEFSERRHSIMQALMVSVRHLFDPLTLEKLAKQLINCSILSASNHAGILSHPFFINANIIELLNNNEDSLIITLHVASISFDNPSYPRGLLLNNNLSDELLRLPLFPRKVLKFSPINYPGYTEENIYGKSSRTSFIETAKHLVRKKYINDRQYEKIEWFANHVLLNKEIIKHKTFYEQSIKINEKLWPHLFVRSQSKLIDISIEMIAKSWLIETLPSCTDTIVYKMIFQKKYRDKLACYFNDVGFSLTKKSGTFLFWGIDNRGRKIGLFEEKEGTLSNNDVAIVLEKNAIITALKSGRLIPSSWLSLLIVMFYAGMVCSGGFMMLDNLFKIKSAWLMFLKSFNQDKEYCLAESVPIDKLSMGSIFFHNNFQGKPRPLSMLDLLLDPIVKEQLQSIKKTTLMQSMIPGLDFMHKIAC